LAKKGNIKFNALIEDEELGTIRAYINFDDNAPAITVDGEERPVRDWYYFGDMVYWLKCKKKSPFKEKPPDGINDILKQSLIPIEPPLSLGQMPVTLWQVLHEAYKFIAIEFEMDAPAWLTSMMKYAVIALVIGAFIFVVAKGKG
jgi:hypothetical protein